MAQNLDGPESPCVTGPLRVLGIDPGLADVGFGVIDVPPGAQPRLVRYGVIHTEAGQPLADRLYQIYRRLASLIEEIGPAVVAIEELFFAKNVKTAMVVAHGRAACILATAGRETELVEYTPLQIKQALTGHGRADKRQVQLMVRAVLGLEEIPKPDHAADALAAALCYVHSKGVAEKVRALADATTDPDEEDPRKRLLEMSRTRRHKRR
jgi:crossover junction endodeoxyribonuclease RuvC